MSEDLKPALLMLAAVLLYSVVPLLIDSFIESESPFLFGAGMALGRAIGSIVLILCVCRQLLSSAIRTHIKRHLFSLTAGFSLIWSFESAVFALATTYVDTAVVSILHELWPIIFMVTLSRLAASQSRGERAEPRYIMFGLDTVILVFLAFLGLALVILGSETDDLNFSNYSENILGICLAIGSAVASSFAAFTIIWGGELKKDLDKKFDLTVSELACVMVAFCLGSLSVVTVTIPIGLIGGEPLELRSLGFAVLIGLVIMVPGSAFFRGAVLATKQVEVTALCYLIPVIAVGWLALFGRIDVGRMDYLTIGGSGIVGANLLIGVELNYGVDRNSRLAFRTLIVSMWTAGVVVYFRDDWFDLVEYNLTWIDDYWAAVTVAMTVFTLLIAFRINRVTDRLRSEENYKVSLVRHGESLQQLGLIDQSDLEDLVRVCSRLTVRDRARQYQRVRSILTPALAQADRDQAPYRDKIAQAERLLDLLILSKQRGRDSAETVAAASFALLTIITVTMTRPDVLGFIAVITDFFAILLASTVLYLLVSAIDLNRERESSVFEVDEVATHRFRIAHAHPERSVVSTSVSSMVIALIFVLWIVLLWQKWS